ncbi:hypothetical protein KXW64_008632, partial [Aspergillus fumigatus]
DEPHRRANGGRDDYRATAVDVRDSGSLSADAGADATVARASAAIHSTTCRRTVMNIPGPWRGQGPVFLPFVFLEKSEYEEVNESSTRGHHSVFGYCGHGTANDDGRHEGHVDGQARGIAGHAHGEG